MPLYHPLDRLTTRKLFARILGKPRAKPCLRLHEAARQGDEDVVRQLIESRFELDNIDERGRSALQIAASSGCSEIFAMLIEAGAATSGFLIPPASAADFCLILARLFDYSFTGLSCAWLASKLYIPIPSFIFRDLRKKIIAFVVITPTLYWISSGLIFWSYPEVFSNSRSIIEALSNFKGDTEYMFLLFLDSDTDLGDGEKLVLWSHAVERGYTGVCQRLLHRGFLVDSLYIHCENPDIVTALLHACGASHRELVLLLLSNSADPTLLDSHGRSCIHMTLARPYNEHAGSIQDSDAILEELLKTDAICHINVQVGLDSTLSDEDYSIRYGYSLLEACENFRIRGLHMLLEADADPNLKPESGWSALHTACHSVSPDSIEIVRLLVRYGADVNATTDLGWTPLGCAASIGSFVDMVEILVEAGAHIESTAGEATALQAAARHDISGGEVMRYLAQKGADVNAIGGKFGSVLLATLRRPWSFILESDRSTRLEDRSLQIIEFILELLQHGLDVNLVPDGSVSPLQLAAEQNLPQVFSFLLEHGAKLPPFKGKNAYPRRSLNQLETPRTVSQSSILSHVRPDHHEMVSILLEHGVLLDVDAMRFGHDVEMTVLGAACSSTNEDYLRTATLLLDHGADPNFRDMHGHFPIQRAAYALSIGHLQKLVECGASVQIDDDKYGSLLHSLCKGYARDGEVERDSEAFLRCFNFLSIRIAHGSGWKPDGAGRNCLHYLAELSVETRFMIKLDRTFTEAESPAVPILEEFLKVHGNPHPLERVPNLSLSVFRMPDLDGKLAFHIASQKGDFRFMCALVEHIKSLEWNEPWDDIISSLMIKPDSRGWNALHHAASEGKAFACMYILESSNVGIATAATASGELAQDLASKNHHDGVAEYIVNYINGRAGDENALRKAKSILASIVQHTNLLEFSEEMLLDIITAESERQRQLLR